MMVQQVASRYATEARFRSQYQRRCCRLWTFHAPRLRNLTEISFPFAPSALSLIHISEPTRRS
eukprot:6868059-Prymnesium_polylepis.2